MYLTHRRTSTSAFLLMFVHVLTVPITTVGLRLGNYLAMIAFLGIVAIVLPTLAPRIPFLSRLTGNTYEGWKKLHRFIGILFIFGFIHSLTIKGLDAFVAINWVQIFFIIGTASYLYTEVFGKLLKNICALHSGGHKPSQQYHHRSGFACKEGIDQETTRGTIPVRAFSRR